MSRDPGPAATGDRPRRWARGPVSELARWIVLGSVVGGLAGLSSAAFLASLSWATDTRVAHGWMLYLLPVAGLLMGLGYHHGAGRAAGGNNLILDEIHEPTAWIPRRMAPLVFVGTIVTHLVGGSAGREGTAIQMSGSLTDGLFSRMLGVGRDDRRILLIAAIGGGFGAVFGVPVAGCVFALEVQSAGRLRHDAIVASMTASLVGDLVVRGVGIHHTALPVIAHVHLRPALVGWLVVAGLLAGGTARAFVGLTHLIRRTFDRWVGWVPLRPAIGGVIVVALTLAVGSRAYLGLSIPLITASLAGGAGVVGLAFVAKLVFTSVTLGSGFQGGEVTPLFVVGATMGVSVARLVGAPVPLFAAVGFVSVFAGATNTPIACTIMGVELFGSGAIVPMALGCIVSYVVSGRGGIYRAQRVAPAVDA